MHKSFIRNSAYTNLSYIYIGLGAGFVMFLVSSMTINSFRIEILIWYIGLIGVVHRMILRIKNEENTHGGTGLSTLPERRRSANA
jgi:hypothetical protein